MSQLKGEGQQGAVFTWKKITIEEKIALKIVKLKCAAQNFSLEVQKNILDQIKANPTLLVPVTAQITAFQTSYGKGLIDLAAVAESLSDQLEPMHDLPPRHNAYYDNFYQLFVPLFEVRHEAEVCVEYDNAKDSAKGTAWGKWKHDLITPSATPHDQANVDTTPPNQIADIYVLHPHLPDYSPAQRLAQRILKQYILKQRKQKTTFTGDPAQNVVLGMLGNAFSLVRSEDPSHKLPSLKAEHRVLVNQLSVVIAVFCETIAAIDKNNDLAPLTAVASRNSETLQNHKEQYENVYTQLEPCLVQERQGSDGIGIQCVLPEGTTEKWAAWAQHEVTKSKKKGQEAKLLAEHRNARSLVQRVVRDDWFRSDEKNGYWFTDGDIAPALKLILGETHYRNHVAMATWDVASFAEIFNQQQKNPKNSGASYTYYVWVNSSDSLANIQNKSTGNHWVFVEFQVTRATDKDKKPTIRVVCYDSGRSMPSFLGNASPNGIDKILNNKAALKEGTKGEYAEYCASTIEVRYADADEYPRQTDGWICGFRTIVAILRAYYCSLVENEQTNFKVELQARIPDFFDQVIALMDPQVDPEAANSKGAKAAKLAVAVNPATVLDVMRKLVLHYTEYTEEALLITHYGLRTSADAGERAAKKAEAEKKFEAREVPGGQGSVTLYRLKPNVIKKFLESTAVEPAIAYKQANYAKQTAGYPRAKLSKDNVPLSDRVDAQQASEDQQQVESYKQQFSKLVENYVSTQFQSVVAASSSSSSSSSLSRSVAVDVNALLDLIDMNADLWLGLGPDEQILAKKALLSCFSDQLIRHQIQSLVLRYSVPLAPVLVGYLATCLDRNTFLVDCRHCYAKRGGINDKKDTPLQEIRSLTDAYTSKLSAVTYTGTALKQITEQQFSYGDTTTSFITLLKVDFQTESGTSKYDWDKQEVREHYAKHPAIMGRRQAFEECLIKQFEQTHAVRYSEHPVVQAFANGLIQQIKASPEHSVVISIDLNNLFKLFEPVATTNATGSEATASLTYIQARAIANGLFKYLTAQLQTQCSEKIINLDLSCSFPQIHDNWGLVVNHFVRQWGEGRRHGYADGVSSYLRLLVHDINAFNKANIDIGSLLCLVTDCRAKTASSVPFYDQRLIVGILFQQLKDNNWLDKVEVSNFAALAPEAHAHFVALMDAELAGRDTKLAGILARNAFLRSYGIEPQILQAAGRDPWDAVVDVLQQEYSQYSPHAGWKFYLTWGLRVKDAQGISNSLTDEEKQGLTDDQQQQRLAAKQKSEHEQLALAKNRESWCECMREQLLPKLLHHFTQVQAFAYQSFYSNQEDRGIKVSEISAFRAQIASLRFAEINLGIAINSEEDIGVFFEELATLARQIKASGLIPCRAIIFTPIFPPQDSRKPSPDLKNSRVFLQAHHEFLKTWAEQGLQTVINITYTQEDNLVTAQTVGANGALNSIPINEAIKNTQATFINHVEQQRRLSSVGAPKKSQSANVVPKQNLIPGDSLVNRHKIKGYAGKSSHTPLVVQREVAAAAEVLPQPKAPAAKAMQTKLLINRDVFITKNSDAYVALMNGYAVIADGKNSLNKQASSDELEEWWDATVAHSIGADGYITPEANQQLLRYAHELRDGFSGGDQALPPGFVVVEITKPDKQKFKVLHFDVTYPLANRSPLSANYVLKTPMRYISESAIEQFATQPLVQAAGQQQKLFSDIVYGLGCPVKLPEGDSEAALASLAEARTTLLQFIAKETSQVANVIIAQYQPLFDQFKIYHLQALFQLLSEQPKSVMPLLERLKTLLAYDQAFFQTMTDNFLSRVDHWGDIADAQSLAALDKVCDLSAIQKAWWIQLSTAHIAASGFGQLGDLFEGFTYFIQQYQEITAKAELPQITQFNGVSNLKVSLRRWLAWLRQAKNEGILEDYLDHLGNTTDKILNLDVAATYVAQVKTLAEAHKKQQEKAATALVTTNEADTATATATTAKADDAPKAAVADPTEITDPTAAAATATVNPQPAPALFDSAVAIQAWRATGEGALQTAGFSGGEINKIFEAYQEFLTLHAADAAEINDQIAKGLTYLDNQIFILGIIATLDYGNEDIQYNKSAVLQLITTLQKVRGYTDATMGRIDGDGKIYDRNLAKANNFTGLLRLCLTPALYNKPTFTALAHYFTVPAGAPANQRTLFERRAAEAFAQSRSGQENPDPIEQRQEEEFGYIAADLAENKHPTAAARTKEILQKEFNADSAIAIIKNIRDHSRGQAQPLTYAQQKQVLECFYFVNAIGSGYDPSGNKPGPRYVYPTAVANLSVKAICQISTSGMQKRFRECRNTINTQASSAQQKLTAQLMVLGLAREALYRTTAEFLSTEHMLVLIQILLCGKDSVPELAKHKDNPAFTAVLAVLLSADNTYQRVHIVEKDPVLAAKHAAQYCKFFNRLGIATAEQMAATAAQLTAPGIHYTTAADLAFCQQDSPEIHQNIPSTARVFTNAEALLFNNAIEYQRVVPNPKFVGEDPQHNSIAWIYPLLNDFVDDPNWFSARKDLSQQDDVADARTYLLQRAGFSKHATIHTLSNAQIQVWLNAALDAKKLYTAQITTQNNPDVLDPSHQQNFDGLHYVVEQKTIQQHNVETTVSVARVITAEARSDTEQLDLGWSGQNFLHARLNQTRPVGQPEFLIAQEMMVHSSLSTKDLITQSLRPATTQDGGPAQRLKTVLLTESIESQAQVQEVLQQFDVALFKVPARIGQEASHKEIFAKDAAAQHEAVIAEVYRGLENGLHPFAAPWWPEDTPPQPIVIACATDAEAKKLFDDLLVKLNDKDSRCTLLQLDIHTPAGPGQHTYAERGAPKGDDANNNPLATKAAPANTTLEARAERPGSITITTRLGLSATQPIADNALVIQTSAASVLHREKNDQLAGAVGQVVHVVNAEERAYARDRKHQAELQRNERQLDVRKDALSQLLHRRFLGMWSNGANKEYQPQLLRKWDECLKALQLHWEAILSKPEYAALDWESRLLHCTQAYAEAVSAEWRTFLSANGVRGKALETSLTNLNGDVQELMGPYEEVRHQHSSRPPAAAANPPQELKATDIDVDKIYVDRVEQLPQPQLPDLCNVDVEDLKRSVVDTTCEKIAADLKEKIPLGWVRWKLRLDGIVNGDFPDVLKPIVRVYAANYNRLTKAQKDRHNLGLDLTAEDRIALVLPNMLKYVNLELEQAYQKNSAPVYLAALQQAQQKLLELARDYGSPSDKSGISSECDRFYGSIFRSFLNDKIKSEHIEQQKGFFHKFASESSGWFRFTPNNAAIGEYITKLLVEYHNAWRYKSKDRTDIFNNVLSAMLQQHKSGKKVTYSIKQGYDLPKILAMLIDARNKALRDDFEKNRHSWHWMPARNMAKSHLPSRLHTLINRVSLGLKFTELNADAIKELQRKDCSNLIEYLIKYLGPDAERDARPKKARSDKFNKLAEALNALKAVLDDPDAEDQNIDRCVAKLQERIAEYDSYIHRPLGFDVNVQTLFKMVAEKCKDMQSTATTPLTKLFDTKNINYEDTAKAAIAKLDQDVDPSKRTKGTEDVATQDARRGLSSKAQKSFLKKVLDHGWKMNQHIADTLKVSAGITDVSHVIPTLQYNSGKNKFTVELRFNFNKADAQSNRVKATELNVLLDVDLEKQKLTFAHAAENNVSTPPATDPHKPVFHKVATQPTGAIQQPQQGQQNGFTGTRGGGR